MNATTQMTLDAAMSAGYRIVSRASRGAARIDRPDWKDVMAASNGGGIGWVNALLRSKSAGDQYRRCYSKDWIIVPASWIGRMPNSGIGPNEYMPK